MLADSHLLLGGTTGECPKVVTDVREVAVRRECTARLEGLEAGSRDHQVALDACKQEFRSRRNQPGGYWIAKDDPQAAEEAVTGAVPLAGLTDVALLSNGVTRLVDPYGLATRSTLLDQCRTDGPGAVLEQLRAPRGRQLGAVRRCDGRLQHLAASAYTGLTMAAAIRPAV